MRHPDLEEQGLDERRYRLLFVRNVSRGGLQLHLRLENN